MALVIHHAHPSFHPRGAHPAGVGVPIALEITMNMTQLDRSQLEEILLNPPSESGEPLVCSDAAVTRHISFTGSPVRVPIRHALAAAHELLTRIASEAIKGRSLVSEPSAVKDFLRIHFAGAAHESFVVVFVDALNRVIQAETMFSGSLTEVSVYIRRIVQRALEHNAAAVILSHVHPSGVAEPSRADEAVTAKAREALNLVDIRLLDHFVVAADGSAITSMAELGLC